MMRCAAANRKNRTVWRFYAEVCSPPRGDLRSQMLSSANGYAASFVAS
jgi:hypothetical protein